MPRITEAFDRVADEYDRARPRYPAGVFDLLSEVAGGLAGRLVVVGASVRGRVGGEDPLVVPYQTTVWTARREVRS